MSDIPEWAMNEALCVLRAAGDSRNGRTLIENIHEWVARAILAAEERARAAALEEAAIVVENYINYGKSYVMDVPGEIRKLATSNNEGR